MNYIDPHIHMVSRVTDDYEALAKMGMTEEQIASATIFVGRGCASCNNTGYKGRVALYEVMRFTDPLKELVLQGCSAAELKAAAGKIIVYHGAADGAFSLQATIDWYEKVRANNGGDASGFARFYPVPGMTHCGGGPSTDRFDLFGALVDWVEHGKAPDSPVATVRADNRDLPEGWSKTRSRPLCDWPKVARYKGGDMESAATFRCE